MRIAALALLLAVAPAAAGNLKEGLLPDAPFPSGHAYYEPLIADPMELGYGGRMIYPPGGPRLGEIMIGDYVGLVRWSFGERWGAQLNLGGGAIGRFNMSTDRNSMEVADFTMALPFDVACAGTRGRHTIRTAFWHTSSHLGDDYIGRVNPPLRKRALDELKTIYSWTDERLRLYAGGAFAFNSINLGGRSALQAGVEMMAPPFWDPQARFFLAQDLQAFERVGWNPSYNIRGGLRFSDAKRIAAASVFLEYFTGRQYYLQFLEAHESHWGFGLKFEIGNPTR